MQPSNSIRRNPWAWIPSLYFVEGLPNAVVTFAAVILYKKLGLSNKDIALYTSWLYLPWVLKPLWSPVVDILKTRRSWIWVMQVIIGGCFAGLALTIPTPRVVQYSLAFFWLIAFGSATQDIAIDGFYLLATTEREQSFFVGIRNTSYKIAAIFGQGALVIFAGFIEEQSGNLRLAWMLAFFLVAAMLLTLGIYHRIVLPRPTSDKAGTTQSLALFWRQFFQTFGAFFRKKNIARMLLFLLFYRFAEAQLVRMVSPFLLDDRAVGGLGLTAKQVGLAYGTVGVIALMCGGLLGGWAASCKGLKFWLWWMVLAIHLPDAVFIYLSYVQPTNFLLINACVAIEQFGYGFGFTAYMLYMIYISRGEHATAHYAICTGFMALGLMLPGRYSGQLQEALGYQHFFLWVLLATIPGFLVVKLIPLDAEFGKHDKRLA